MKTFIRLATVALCLTGSVASRAEVSEVTIARQPSLGHLPLMVMQERKLLEAKAAELGLPALAVKYVTFAGGAAMNDALLSGAVQFAAGGVPPLLLLWSKTANSSLRVKGVSAMSSMPLILSTNKESVHTLADFGEGDKIALPAVKVSIQAILLQMASEKVFGPDQRNKLDRLTVTMSHPDGMAALLARQDVTAHFTASPIQELEAKSKGIRSILNSYDIMGGPNTFTVVWASTKFKDDNPTIYKAFVAALDEAMSVIRNEPNAAIDAYLKLTKDPSSTELLKEIVSNPQIIYTTTPQEIGKYLDFMSRTGSISQNAPSWRDVFFENVKNGS